MRRSPFSMLAMVIFLLASGAARALTADIDIEKETNAQDADTAPGPQVPVGSLALFGYVVRNTGEVPLGNVQVRDDAGTPGDPGDDFTPAFVNGDGNGNGLLDLTEVWLYSAQRVVTAGQHASVATVTGDDPVAGPASDSDPSHHFGLQAAIHIETLTAGEDADAAPGPPILVGQVATFDYLLTNVGNVPLADVDVVDDNGTPATPGDDFSPVFLSGDTNADARLDVGETWAYTATRVVTPGQYGNTATASGQRSGVGSALDGDASHHFGVVAGIDIEASTNGQDADTPSGPQLALGQIAAFGYTVRNTGNVPLASVAVVDDGGTPGTPGDDFNPDFLGGDTNDDGLLDVSEVWTYAASRTVTSGQYANRATVTANEPTAGPVSDSDASHHLGVGAPGIRIEVSTNGQDADTPPGPQLRAGSVVTFGYVVTNTGNVPLGSVVVIDDGGTAGPTADDFSPAYVSGDSDNDSLLDLSETWIYSATRVARSGQYANIATATGVDPIAGATGDSDASHYFGIVAAVDIEKATNGEDADTPTGPQLGLGDNARFTYLVTNPGNVPMASVAVVDDNGTPDVSGDDFSPGYVTGDGNNDSLLDVTETWVYSADHTVTTGQYRNVATVTATHPIGGAASDSDASHHVGAGIVRIHIEKSTNGQDADTPSGPMLPVGSTVTFGYAVTNTGNVPLSGVVVVDDNGTSLTPGDDFNPVFVGGDTNNDNLLDVTETWSYSATRTVTAGLHASIATASGNDPISGAASDSDPSYHFGVTARIHIEKETNGQDADTPTGPQLAVGTQAIFGYVVTNDGNVALGNVVVVDDSGTPTVPGDDFNPAYVAGDTNNNGLLDVSELWLYSATRTVTAGQHSTRATATGSDPTAGTASHSDPSHYFGLASAIHIQALTNGDDANTPPGPRLPVGTTASFEYRVTNPGNVRLGNVAVVDNNGTPNNAVDDFSPTFLGGDANNDGFLNVTETWRYGATRTVTPGQHANLARASASHPSAGSATDIDPNHHFGLAIGIDIETLTNGEDADFPPGPQLLVNGTAFFRYVVTNTGNAPLTNVVVVDDNGTPANTGDDFNPGFSGGDFNNNAMLDVGEAWIYDASRTVTPGQFANSATVTGSEPVAGQASDSDASHHLGGFLGIDIEASVNGEDADSPTGPQLAVGTPVTFRYVVRNTGDVPLDNVVVVDDNGTPGNVGDDFVPGLIGGDTNADTRLDVDEVWTFTATRTVQAGQVRSTATVTADNAGLGVATDSDPSHYIGLVARIRIETSTNGEDADTPTGPQLAAGDTVTFGYALTNVGGIPLGNVVVVDDNGTPGVPGDDFSPVFQGGDANGNGLLDLTETWTYTASASVAPGQFRNVATATGSDPIAGQTTDSDPSHHFGLVAAIAIQASTNGQDADLPIGPRIAVGSAAALGYVVTNTGNVALRNVTVTDDNGTPGLPGDDFSPVLVSGDVNANLRLDVTETWTYAATHTVTIGQFANRAVVSASDPVAGPASASDPSHHFGVEVGIDIEKSVSGQDADAPPGPQLLVGSNAPFSYVVTNIGNGVLGNVVVVDDNGTPGVPGDDFSPVFQGGDANGNGLLDLTETWTYTASRVVTPGQHADLATVTGQDAVAGQTADSDPSHHIGLDIGINIEKRTNGEDADTPPGPRLAVGDSATFFYEVSNTGDLPLGDVVVSDDNGTPGDAGDDFHPVFLGGDTDNDGLLDLTETWVYSAGAVVGPGQFVSVATVTAVQALLGPTSDSDPSHHLGLVLGIDIEKSTNGQDADVATGPLLLTGSTATFEYVVTNTGNTPLGSVTVKDDNGTPNLPLDDFSPAFVSGDTNNDGMLDLSEIWRYSATRTVTLGQYRNLATVTASEPSAGTASDSDPSHHRGFGVVGIDIEKETNAQDADEPTGPQLVVGTPAIFGYLVRNTGDLPLDNVVVVDDNGTPGTPGDDFNPDYVSGDANGNGLLDATETWLYTAIRVVTVGQHRNVATVTGDDPAAGQATDSDPSHHFGLQAAIDIETSIDGQDADAPPGPRILAGAVASFEYVVTNTGNVALRNVAVVDNNGTPLNATDDFSPAFTGGDANSNSRLDVGEVWTYGATRTVVAGQFSHLTRATGNDPIAGTASDSDPGHFLGFAGGIDVETSVNGQDADTATGPLLRVGGVASFGYLVRNTGDVALANVVLVDDNGTPGDAADDFNPISLGGDSNNNGLLDLSEVWSYSASKVVTPGQFTNTARVQGAESSVGPVSDSDPSNHFGLVVELQLETSTNGIDADDPEAGDAPQIAAGDTVSWTYRVTNAGNGPLQSVSVSDDQGVVVDCPKDTLDPAEVMTCSGGAPAELLMNTLASTVPGRCGDVTTLLYRNTATAAGESALGDIIEDSDPSHYCNPVPIGLGACSTVEREMALPGGRTRVFNVQQFFSIDPVSCPTGYVVAWAKSANKQPIEWNYLTGSTYFRSPGGAGLNRTQAAQAVAIAGDPTGLVDPLQPLVGAQGGLSPVLPFDGTAYAQTPRVLSTDFFATGGTRGSRISVMDTDVNLPLVNPQIQTDMTWWNEAGDTASSTALDFRCHVRKRLEDIDPGLTQSGLGSFYGKLEIAALGGSGILGVIEEVAPNRLAMRNMNNLGLPPPATTLNFGGNQPGSAVIFPLFDISLENGEPGTTVQRITNTFFDKDLEVQPVVDVHLMLICGEGGS